MFLKCKSLNNYPVQPDKNVLNPLMKQPSIPFLCSSKNNKKLKIDSNAMKLKVK
ncbi:hypothetical protein PROVALCAL_01467 [Providencia alcalifaciens DSM 30120]|uniref:Uncharacterized protein n=1 Tax=Providencia alcalifaciens DSM 30120 TaxID=520999 RepID=B6XDP3_9GAMM|nr:hypothetical protein PROVALCAL_01467 [Providencia alcalifaciens DSM 30120]